MPDAWGWSICRDQLCFFFRRWRLLADTLQDADQRFQEVVTVRVTAEKLQA